MTCTQPEFARQLSKNFKALPCACEECTPGVKFYYIAVEPDYAEGWRGARQANYASHSRPDALRYEKIPVLVPPGRTVRWAWKLEGS